MTKPKPIPDNILPITIKKNSEAPSNEINLFNSAVALINTGNKIVPRIFFAPYEAPKTRKLTASNTDDITNTIKDKSILIKFLMKQ